MKLERLQLSQFKQFRQSLEVDGLEPGINLWVGPNESGKSTLVAALRAAFFERYKSTSVENLQPWGDSSAAPEVSLTFTWHNQRWTLHKRFLKQPRCDLEIDQQHYSGEEAEEKLAELFGYTFAGRGASRPELWGIPGLLWVEQGSIQDIRDPVEHAGNYLKPALGSTLGEITSSSGDELIVSVESQRSQWLTSTGKPTGEYKKTIAQCEERQARLAELAKRIEAYRDKVDELGRLRQLQQDIDAAHPWEAQLTQAREAQKQLEEVQQWQQQQQHDQAQLDTCRQSQDLFRQQIKSHEAAAQQLEQRANDQHKAQAELDELNAHKPQLDQQHQAALEAYEQANAMVVQARQQANGQRLQKEHDQLATSLEQSRENLKAARQLQHELDALRARQQHTDIDAKLLKKLKTVQTQLSQSEAKLEAVASRLAYELDTGKSLRLGEEDLSGKGERLLLEPVELAIPDIGRLRLLPGGADVAELKRQRERQQDERDNLLQRLDIKSLEEGEQRATSSQELARQIEAKVIRLEAAAPDGIDALASHCQWNDRRLAQLAEQLSGFPQPQPDLPDEQAAEKLRDKAQARLTAAEGAVQAHKTDVSMARQALKTATAEWENLNTELQAPNCKERERHANDQLINLRAEEKRLDASLTQRKAQIEAAQPDALSGDVERFTRSAEAMQSEANQRAQAIDRLEVELQTLGAQGLEEARDTLQQEADQLARRRDELQHRAAALDLLLTLLRGKRQDLTRQLQAPLQKHLNHYLQLLFPQASISVDENLIPDSLNRRSSDQQNHEQVAGLSYGAREQMGLISRLAYADLMREADRPTLIILDDAMVHCDSARLERVKRILFDAAQRHQILLLSCHPQTWHDLGTAPRDLQTLKAAAA